MTALDFISATASVVAAIVAVIALWRTRKLPAIERDVHQTQNSLNKLLLRKARVDAEKAECADFSANIIKIGSTKWRLKIANKGKAPAKNVDVDFPDSNLVVGAEAKFPMRVMEPGDSVELPAAASLGGPSKIQVRIIWEDEFQGKTEKMLTPTL